MGVCRCARHGAEKSSSRCARRALRGSPCAGNARDTNDAPPRSSAPEMPPAGGTRVMCTYSLSHLSDSALLRDLAALVAHDRATTAVLLAHVAEVDERRLYLPAAYPSMYAYCVGELRLCEQAAFKRIRAARTARRFPAIFPALAEGRLHLSGVVMLASYLTPENADELLAAELAAMLDLAFDLLVGHLAKRKFAATPRPRPGTRRATGRRTIPARVKRAVWERDGGQCTFTSDTGRRCPARTRLEYDHADPVARGGTATVERMRLRCRAHNQYAAECTFGAGFMSQKRREAQLAPGRVEARARGRAAALEPSCARAAEAESASIEPERDVIPWLRRLGFSAEEARRAAAQCESIPE